MSNEKSTLLNTANKSLFLKLVWMNKSRIRLEFKGSCSEQNKVLFTPSNEVNLFTVYELSTCSKDLNTEFTLWDCLLGNVKTTKNPDRDKYPYSGYGIGFISIGVKTPLLLKMIWALMCILIIKMKID